MQTWDTIVIGAGHNGLVCAAYLARAGQKVLVLERRDVIGGAAVTEEVWPGIRVSVASYLMSLLQPRIIQELELRRHGLELLPCNFLFTPYPDGNYSVWSDSQKETVAEIARFSRKDAAVYPEFDAYLQDSAKIVRQLLWATPVDPTTGRLRDIREAVKLVWQYRKIGRKFYRIVDLLTQSVYDYLDRWFESDMIKAILSYYSGIGTFAGPKMPGTAYVLLHHLMGESEGAGGWGFVRGGMGSVSKAIAGAAQQHGTEIRTGAVIERVLVEGGHARGVVLAGGEEIRAKRVVSNANVKHLFLKLVEERELPAEFLAEVRSYRTESSAFKINFALKRLPQYTAYDAAKVGRPYPTYMHIAPSVDYLERAYDDAKYGGIARQPFATIVSPSAVDDSLAPPGTYVVNLFGGHAPYTLRDGTSWDEGGRETLLENVLKVWETYAPGVRDDILHAQVLAAPDLEKLIGLPNGHIFHGELAPDQLFFQRPVPHYADYRSPIRGLYQCGASTHPGGGVMGVPGYNAAREILKDSRRG